MLAEFEEAVANGDVCFSRPAWSCLSSFHGFVPYMWESGEQEYIEREQRPSDGFAEELTSFFLDEEGSTTSFWAHDTTTLCGRIDIAASLYLNICQAGPCAWGGGPCASGVGPASSNFRRGGALQVTDRQ